MDFYRYDSPQIRYTGRFAPYCGTMSTTQCGSYFEFRYSGGACVLAFDTSRTCAAYPHLYLEVDGCPRVEAGVEEFIRVGSEDGDKDAVHSVRVIFKSADEFRHRWYLPLDSVVAFKGVYCGSLIEPLPDERMTVEFVGDSITEGVLIDTGCFVPWRTDGANRVYVDDVTATYAWLTAEKLGLRPFFHAHGGDGVTHGGSADSPDTVTSYPYCFDGAEATYPDPDLIVINIGTNDRGRPDFEERYIMLLDEIRRLHPSSRLVILPPFIGCWTGKLKEIASRYEKETGCPILFVDTDGWISPEPLHPLRDGHRAVAENLSKALGAFIESIG